jgi:hypothetical protein
MMRGEAKVTLRKHVASVCHVISRCERTLFLCMCSFDFMFYLSVMDDRIEQCVCVKFCVKFGKSTTETVEMLHEAFGEHSLSETGV